MTVHLHSDDARIRNLVKDAVGDVSFVSGRKNLPKRADYLVTGGQLNRDTEYMAARYGTYAVVLPEASDWLRAQAPRGLTLVGSDMDRVVLS